MKESIFGIGFKFLSRCGILCMFVYAVGYLLLLVDLHIYPKWKGVIQDGGSWYGAE